MRKGLLAILLLASASEACRAYASASFGVSVTVRAPQIEQPRVTVEKVSGSTLPPVAINCLTEHLEETQKRPASAPSRQARKEPDPDCDELPDVQQIREY